MTAEEKLALIKLKVTALLNQVNSLEQTVEKQRKDLKNMEEALLLQTKRAEILEDKNKISKLADGIQLGKQDITEVKKSINRYVREIDECLKLLNHLPNNN